jgi:hypothetical protein
MTSSTGLRLSVETYWATAEARDWTGFEATLAEDVVYDLPQTRERIRGRADFLRFNREYPADWHLRVERIIADAPHAPGAAQAVTWCHFTVGLEQMHAITFFTADAQGRISTITDFWPEPYEPPTGREHLVERY